jgi:hypothetical protein
MLCLCIRLTLAAGVNHSRSLVEAPQLRTVEQVGAQVSQLVERVKALNAQRHDGRMDGRSVRRGSRPEQRPSSVCSNETDYDYWLRLHTGPRITQRPKMPLRSEVSEACHALLKHRSIVWVAGAPGTGKTVIGQRMQEYGFMVFDCEDNPTRQKAVSKGGIGAVGGLLRMTERALEHRTSAFAFPSCDQRSLERRPSSVCGVMLMPSRDVYERRWKARQAAKGRSWTFDRQNHDKFYNDSERVALTTPGVVNVWQHQEECIDMTVWRVCSMCRAGGYADTSDARRNASAGA